MRSGSASNSGSNALVMASRKQQRGQLLPALQCRRVLRAKSVEDFDQLLARGVLFPFAVAPHDIQQFIDRAVVLLLGAMLPEDVRPAHPPIRNEAGNGLRNDRGTIAMARTNVVDSATAQFFINVVNNDFLNHMDESPRGFGYAVFGKVIEGMEVVDKIRAVPTGRVSMFQDVPRDPVTILKAVVLTTGDPE